MALVKCLECKKVVSSEAEICPNCGVKINLEKIEEKKKKDNKNGGIGCLIVIGITLFILLLNNQKSDETDVNKDNSSNAYYYSREIVENNLKSPISAKFPSFNPNFVSKNENIYTITAYVDSQNSFGAMIRSSYKCVIKEENELFYLQDISID
jgi:hypothetical protein